MVRWIARWLDRQMVRWIAKWLDRQMVRWIARWLDGQIDGQMNRWLDGQMVRWLDGQKGIPYSGYRITRRESEVTQLLDKYILCPGWPLFNLW